MIISSNKYIQITQMSSIRDFVPLSKLGQGAFSTVYKVRRLSDQKIYALKKMRMKNLSHKQTQNALNEIRILASIQCYSIVGYKQAFFDQKLSLLCIVMEFADKGDLQKYILQAKNNNRRISEKIIWRMMADILVALKGLHDRGILHRDIKTANIFISSMDSRQTNNEIYKLGDLNVSKVNHGNLAYTQTGTPYYASPQVWRDEPYDHKSDIWSFGCIVYEMANLIPPFNGKDMEDLFKNVQSSSFKPIHEEYSYELADTIDRCLLKKPSNRPTVDELLQHIIVTKFVSLRMNMITCHDSESKQNARQLNDFEEQYIKLFKAKDQRNPSIQKNKIDLLETIKLPIDLKLLQSKLPIPKYSASTKQSTESLKKNISKNYSGKKHQNMNFISDRPQLYQNSSKNIEKVQYSEKNTIQTYSQRKNPDQREQRENVQKRHKNESAVTDDRNNAKDRLNTEQKARINKSEVFMSPRNIKNSEKNQSYLYRSPQDAQMSRKYSYDKMKYVYSDRKILNNDSGKLDKKQMSEKKGESLIDKYEKLIRQSNVRKQHALPRTQKKNISGHAQSLKQTQAYPKAASYNDMIEWKKKLAKKSRVLSNNSNIKHFYAYPY